MTQLSFEAAFGGAEAETHTCERRALSQTTFERAPGVS